LTRCGRLVVAVIFPDIDRRAEHQQGRGRRDPRLSLGDEEEVAAAQQERGHDDDDEQAASAAHAAAKAAFRFCRRRYGGRCLRRRWWGGWRLDGHRGRTLTGCRGEVDD